MEQNDIKEVVNDTTNLADSITNFSIQLTDEEIKEREDIFNIALNKINEYGLDWTFRSINYIVKRHNITFNQLRSCIFKGKDGEVGYDLFKAVQLIIEAGLVGSKQIEENKTSELENKAYDIIEDWRNNLGYIGILQILLINIMEKKHFFMGTQDLKVLELLSYKNLQKDIANIQMAMEIEQKVSQSQAVQ